MNIYKKIIQGKFIKYFIYYVRIKLKLNNTYLFPNLTTKYPITTTNVKGFILCFQFWFLNSIYLSTYKKENKYKKLKKKRIKINEKFNYFLESSSKRLI